MEGLENEEGGEERKIWGGGGGNTVLLLCQGMPLTEIEGYCLYVHELFWTWRLIGEGPLNILASLRLSLVPSETGL